MNQELINALFCALNILRGTGGGFSPHEKRNAADALEIEMRRLVDEGEEPGTQPGAAVPHE